MSSSGHRTGSLDAALARAGFSDVPRAATLLTTGLLGDAREQIPPEQRDLTEAFQGVADPDLALLGLARLGDAAEAASRAELVRVIADGGATRRYLLALFGGSAALADWVIAHPEQMDVVVRPRNGVAADPGTMRTLLLEAVGADPESDMPVASEPAATGTLDAMRVAYRRILVAIAAEDLTSSDPESFQPEVAGALANLAAAALEAALALARAELPDGGRAARLAVLGMGKTGGRELNYISDVDVIYVVEPADGADEDEALRVGTKLATGLARMCSSTSREPALWEVDPNLRPEGRHGPLVRTLSSHVAYYERWAKTWEFQALLKARHVAGDRELAQEYLAATRPMVWDAVGRENFVEDAQAMRRRVEEHVPPAEVDRQIKLGRGGLRDVEFTVQLLQLVHGRVDPSIRSSNTLTALSALSAAGYVGRDHAAELARCYRFLRLLEHRIQLSRMRRTHLMPTAEQDLLALSRSVGAGIDGIAGLQARWRATRREVRRLHEELFYRPLLPATARLSADDVSLAPEAALARLGAIGYRDPKGAQRHISALTEGLSRRASIQRQLLPVMLGWFAEGPDPDGGLLAFRKLSEALGSTHWYLKLLRDSSAAGERLAHLLSSSQYVAEGLTRSPESVAWLDDEHELKARSADAVMSAMRAMIGRKDEADPAAQAVRFVRRRELTRGAIGDVLSDVPVETGGAVISPAADVALAGALRIATIEATRSAGLDAAPSRFSIIAMGRLGGSELGYASDADVLFVHDPQPGVAGETAEKWANAVAQQLLSLLGSGGTEPPLPVDTQLRPEGRNGPMVRSLAAYREYYERWALGWERQALLRARPVAGDEELSERFVELIDPLRYPIDGLPAGEVRELRRIKARVESERLPRGVPPTHHLKLGRGGLADVEWTAQLLQLQHAGRTPELRTTSTLGALTAARSAGLLSPVDTVRLSAAWSLATRLRNAIVLWSGRTTGNKVDVLPSERDTLAGVSRLMGYRPGHSADLEQDWLRAARRARAVVERVFFA
ncbi:bifunctional [glutamine synthetase] adenylyltransferase/[glutamine synthetase]-adenylyl-L-tyrosine phosphorylase [Pseudactinotalea sp.]|uniref:bifunctional [glutamine synthetase] adenylyltransferase/[glutamine synthetase]-adenylyl-L-tyrosine phosphorylase n=1 Tax=Pseudactinotalea sp. TaxID=1926260 RepID=UPI003B3B3112